MNKPFFKEFEIRWSDVDANRHLGNFAYINMMSHSRMSLMNQIGFGHEAMKENGIGPILFREEIHYFREVLPGTPLRISVALKRVSEDFRFFSFEHRFYSDTGRNVAYGEITGSWMNLEERRVVRPPQKLLDAIDEIPKSIDFRFFRPGEIRLEDIYPVDLEE